jgi:hypothetical protein
MLRSLLVSLWIVSATLGATYFGATMQGGKSAPETPQTAKAAPIRLKSMTVPVVSGGAVQGFVLTQLTVSAKPDLLKTLPQPPDLLLNDEAFKTIYGEEQIDFKRIEKLDLAKLSKKICDNINKRAGAPVVEEVFIQELHFMNKHDASAEGQRPRH